MRSPMLAYPILFALSLQGSDALSGEAPAEPKLVPVELTVTERLNLLAAPQVFLRSKPSEALAQAIAAGSVEAVRADRLENDESQAVQGWIYYSKFDGYQPIVLCISETFPVLDWMHCQEHKVVTGITVSTEP
jgi:hypothetical protein